ncbi:MAG: recombinase family protein [Brevundimonas sp.]|nr:MAG: recombinase family protein [Brevundimonas sp.]
MNPAARPLRCAIYTRKSTEEGLDQDYNSLHAQRDACAAYVMSQAGEGWTLSPEFYDDGGFSGGTMERPALKRLLAEIEAGRIDVVVVYKVDRLTRALTDFSKIVDVLDKAGASFVSVTQAFNTTTSMGRLTLNVLLSFAQFEREVTGERIRDKIAASKKLGMWMGGCLPLGYDAAGRTLKINQEEARTVRWIFDRYLEVGSAHQVCDELAAAKILSKAWSTKAGTQRGGRVIDRGALFHILHNRTYVGEIPHKDTSYPGQHPAIINGDVFAAVQAKLADRGRKPRAKGEPRKPQRGAPLMGLIHDTAGNLMSPVSGAKRAGATYRYYVSTAVQSGRPSAAGAVPRVSAPLVEETIASGLQAIGLVSQAEAKPNWGAIRDLIHRVELGLGTLTIELDGDTFDRYIRDMSVKDRMPLDRLPRSANGPILKLSVDLERRGGAAWAVGPLGGSATTRNTVDPAFAAAITRAEAWKNKLMTGEVATVEQLAKAEHITAPYASRLVRLAFLAPDLKAAILDGRQPRDLTLQLVSTQDIPLDWDDQRRLYAA